MRQGSFPRWRPLIALLLPPLVWFLFQQGLSGLMRGRCDAGGPFVGLLWGGSSLILCGLALWLACTAAIRADLPVSKFVARMAMLGAGVFALAILFQTLATLIVPSCVR